ncbi:MAG: glycosyltransferase [Leptolyngbyaceae cyanobacterium SM2_3_12]|nr:glycosyltransferase [Leptolyngbyaceae cyanobacterium SM2_3_12]
MSKLVSIIIPCFNAERWITEAIESCLNQTYNQVEIIVVDDGSTDRSLSLIQRFGDQITWVTGPNCGGNHARNRGFHLSQGDYIQYLDADDYLYPDKISRQVQHLETAGGDFVYGDWQYQYHKFGGRVFLDEVQISGTQSDMVESLLGLWWIATACPLYRRTTVEQVGGWDESLRAAQDRDFLLSVVLAGAQATYQPGCVSVYRRYGNVTVSTASTTQYVESHLKVLQKLNNCWFTKAGLARNIILL